MSLELIIGFIGVFSGILARTFMPWLRKVRDGKVVKFDRRFTYATLTSIFIGFLLTLSIFPNFTTEMKGDTTFDVMFKAFCLAFSFGFGWNGLVLEGAHWAGAFDPRVKIRREE